MWPKKKKKRKIPNPWVPKKIFFIQNVTQNPENEIYLCARFNVQNRILINLEMF